MPLDADTKDKVKKQVNWAYLTRIRGSCMCMGTVHGTRVALLIVPPLGPPAQIEFYFSESNLPRDNFLKGKVAEDADGFVDLALICIFSRMNNLLKTSHKEASKVPPEKVADVAEALEGSTLLVLSEDKTRVRRAEVRAGG